ncbi:MAG: GNAT family N-acetyltransferase [Planctomycetota bacterium]|nr:GNAT family N-acetyltransferase [Planctomycetota bacterium]
MSTTTTPARKLASAPAPLVVLEDPAALATLAKDWDALLEASRSPSLFLTSTWVTTWWEVFGQGGALHVVCVRSDAGELIGVAPFFVRTGVEGLPAPLRVLMLIGQQGDTLAEELDVIARPGAEAEVAEAVSKHLIACGASTWDAIWFERVRADSAVMPHIEAALAGSGLEVERRNAQPSAYLPLPDSMEALTGALSKNFRRQLRNARNRLGREGDVALRFAGVDVTVEEAMATLVRLHRERWGPDDGSFDTDAYVRFHQALSLRLFDEDRLMLVLLTLDGTPIAARYDFLYGERIWCFQGGWDPAYERMRVGTLLTADVLEWGIENGYVEYAFLSGDDPYKRRWTDASRELFDLFAWGRSGAARRARRKERLVAALRAIPPVRWLVRRLRGG